jgi:hypothetical protein
VSIRTNELSQPLLRRITTPASTSVTGTKSASASPDVFESRGLNNELGTQWLCCTQGNEQAQATLAQRASAPAPLTLRPQTSPDAAGDRDCSVQVSLGEGWEPTSESQVNQNGRVVVHDFQTNLDPHLPRGDSQTASGTRSFLSLLPESQQKTQTEGAVRASFQEKVAKPLWPPFVAQVQYKPSAAGNFPLPTSMGGPLSLGFPPKSTPAAPPGKPSTSAFLPGLRNSAMPFQLPINPAVYAKPGALPPTSVSALRLETPPENSEMPTPEEPDLEWQIPDPLAGWEDDEGEAPSAQSPVTESSPEEVRGPRWDNSSEPPLPRRVEVAPLPTSRAPNPFLENRPGSKPNIGVGPKAHPGAAAASAKPAAQIVAQKRPAAPEKTEKKEGKAPLPAQPRAFRNATKKAAPKDKGKAEKKTKGTKRTELAKRLSSNFAASPNKPGPRSGPLLPPLAGHARTPQPETMNLNPGGQPQPAGDQVQERDAHQGGRCPVCGAKTSGSGPCGDCRGGLTGASAVAPRILWHGAASADNDQPPPPGLQIVRRRP